MRGDGGLVWWRRLLPSSAIPVRTRAIFFAQLSVLINAGVPLVRSMDVLRDGESHAVFREIIASVAISLSQGRRLSDALAAHPGAFDPLVCGLVKVGERVGLSKPVMQASHILTRREELRLRVTSALRYPVLVMLCAALMSFALFRWVLPGLLQIPPRGTTLPLISRCVGVLVWAAGNSAVVLCGVFLAVLVIHRFLKRLEDGAFVLRLEGWLSRLPLVGALMASAAQIQLCRALSVQLSCGVHVLPALDLARTLCYSETWKARCVSARAAVMRGQSLSEAFAEECPAHAELFLGMLRLGDESGDYSVPLTRVADLLEEDFNTRLGIVMDVLTPLLLLGAGCAALLALLAALLPLQQMLNGL